MNRAMRSILFIDNEDSFVYNLVDACASRGHAVDVFRSDWAVDDALAYISSERPDLVVLSPGPNRPCDATLCMRILESASPEMAIFGVCLGFQCIVQHFGGRVEPTEALAHGKAAQIMHNDAAVWRGIENPFLAGRYHSLAASIVPDCLEVIATMGSMVMAVRHRSRRMVGVQFHPESVLTPAGQRILDNVIDALCGE